MYEFEVLFAAAELPFLILAVGFAFLTARALRGGAFGRGFRLLAWGFLVMAIGHLNMLIESLFEVNPITRIFGQPGGSLVWLVALVATWLLSWLGFYNLYKVGKPG